MPITCSPGKFFSVFLFSLLWLVAPGPAVSADFIYTVQPGDHPWNLAQRYLRSAALGERLRQLNGIGDDRRLMPGMRLRIPQDWLKLETARVRLLAVAGETTLQPGDAAIARPAKAGEMLQAPASLRTGADGSATLQFADGSLVLLRRDSELRLRQTQAAPLGKASLIGLELLRGSLENQVTPIGNRGGRFEIRSPAATAAVRGTSFRLSVEPRANGAAVLRTEVIEGAVNVASGGGQVLPRSGQGSVAQAGQTPAEPVSLLPAPVLDSLPERIERLPIDLPIHLPVDQPVDQSIAAAAGFRTQIAADASFRVMASDETSPAARIRARDIEDGHYVLRVRAIDAQGLEGLSAERRLVVHARPEPPLLLEPSPDAAVAAEQPVFRWTEADTRLGYRLQIMAEASQQIVSDQTVEGAEATAATALPAAPYRWRVAAVDPVKSQGPWSDVQRFRRVLPGPVAALAQPDSGALGLRWSAQPQTAGYRLQLARDDGFETPVIDTETDTPQYPPNGPLEGLAPGVVHVRIQAIGNDGQVGPWSAVQRFTVPEAPSSDWRVLWLLLPALLLF